VTDESEAFEQEPVTAPAGRPESQDGWSRGRDSDGSQSADDVHPDETAEFPVETVSVIGGFWRRTLAFALDSILLGVVGAVVGSALFDALANLGAWGRLLGFGLSLAYFASLDSSFGGGATLGKRVLKLRVVNRSGECISLGRAALRYSILAAPIYLNQLMLPTSMLTGIGGVALNTLLFGLGGATMYLYVFNRRTRQATHDLAAGTFVVGAASNGPVEGKVWRTHLILAAVWVAFVAAGSVWAGTAAMSKLPPGLLRAVTAIEATGDTHSATVFIGKTWGDDGETDYVNVSSALKKNPGGRSEAISQELATLVLREFPEANDVDQVSVTISRGFDIGIASGWKRSSVSKSPQEWLDSKSAP